MPDINLEELKEQKSDLTEEQLKQIADSAYSDEDLKGKTGPGEPPDESPKGDGEKTEPEETEPGDGDAEKSDEELLDADEETLTDGEKSRRQELLVQKEQELVETPDDQLDEEQLAQKQKLVKKQEEEGAKSEEQRAKDYAEKNGLSVEDAKKELESIDEIKSRYDGDVDKVAKSNLYLQRMASKAKNELKRMQEASQMQEVTPQQMDKMVQEGRFIVKGKAWSKEDLVSVGRRNPEWADIVESMDDEQVYRLTLKDLAKRQNHVYKQQGEKIKQTASVKRTEAIRELANHDNRFYEEAKGIIENLDEKFIANDSFDVKHVLTQVKGARYDQDIKAVREESFKKGQEQAKILRTKPPVGEGKSKKAKPKGGVSLSASEKKRALDKYESLEISDEQKFKMHAEDLKRFKKKNKEE